MKLHLENAGFEAVLMMEPSGDVRHDGMLRVEATAPGSGSNFKLRQCMVSPFHSSNKS